MERLIRILFLPLGFCLKVFELAVEGSRDIHNSLRFKNSKIDRRCCINSRSIIGEHCHILDNCLINNSNVDQYTYIGRNSIVQNATIGSYCSIANDVFIGLGAHPLIHFSTSPLFYRVSNPLGIKAISKDLGIDEYSQIRIGNDVWIGSRAILMDAVTVGDGAVIAAGAVVTKDVAPYTIVGGVPAKVIRQRFHSEKIEQFLELQWWSWPLAEIQRQIESLRSL